MSLTLILSVLIFGYLLFYKPEIVAIILFSIVFSNINIEIDVLPLNVRAILTLSLTARIIADRTSGPITHEFVTSTSAKLFLFFMAYIFTVTTLNGLFGIELVKIILSTCLNVYCAYYFFKKYDSARIIQTSLLIGGMVCLIDLSYTYIIFRSFPVQRLYGLVVGGNVNDIDPEELFIAVTNHNFFGQVCGMCFVFIFCQLVKSNKPNKWLVILLPLMFLGILMSTSRSALFAAIIIPALITVWGTYSQFEKKRASRIILFSSGSIILAVVLFYALGQFLLDARFVEEISKRMTEEPIAIFNRLMGQDYNIQNLGSMDWRKESLSNAIEVYYNLNFHEQFFGIGLYAYVLRNLGGGLNVHNGIMLILIENGIVGFIIYSTIIFYLLKQSFRLKNISPSLAVVGFILVYGIGQNGELTDAITFILIYIVFAENEKILSVIARKDFNRELSLR